VNELKNISSSFNIENMGYDDLQLVINQFMQQQYILIRKDLNELKEEQEITKKEVEIMKSENETLRELEIKRHRAEEHKYGYISLSDLGQCYQISIGAKTMGKLLRLAGIAKAKQSKTEPLRSCILDGTAKSTMYGDFPTYYWNPDKCIKKIDEWMNGIGVVDKFYAIENEKELIKFINNLEQNYGEK